VLSIDGAYRISDYSTTGSATTWKTGFIWSPIRDITLRGTIAEATRAPNIGELFDPGGQTFEDIDDPCDATNVDEGSANRVANCAALLAALGVDTSVPYQDQNTAFIGGTLTGNRNLTEEVAKTKTLGIVLRPSFAPTLSIAVDWYDIELSDAISTADPEQAAEICVDSASIDNQFCALLTREPGTGTIVDFIQQPQNVANFLTEGYDFTIAYGFEAGRIGNFALRAVGNKLEELTFVRLPGSEPDIALGEGAEDAPKWQANFDLTWQLGVVSVNYGLNYFDKTLRYEHSELQGDPDLVEARYRYFDRQLTHDIQGRVDLENGLSMYAGINNFMDQKPDIGADAFPVSPLGRYLYAGLSFRGF
jgi:iron complex outermembrane recepter protein